MTGARRTTGERVRRLALADAAATPSPVSAINAVTRLRRVPGQRDRRTGLISSLLDLSEEGGP